MMNQPTTITIQPGNTPDGTYDVHQPMPYPYHVDVATGEIGRQEFWRGAPFKVIGFQSDAAVQKVDLFWERAVENPEQIKGMYAVLLDTSESEPTIYNLTCPITDVYFPREVQKERMHDDA